MSSPPLSIHTYSEVVLCKPVKFADEIPIRGSFRIRNRNKARAVWKEEKSKYKEALPIVMIVRNLEEGIQRPGNHGRPRRGIFGEQTALQKYRFDDFSLVTYYLM